MAISPSSVQVVVDMTGPISMIPELGRAVQSGLLTTAEMADVMTDEMLRNMTFEVVDNDTY